jgi:hypothetical protein
MLPPKSNHRLPSHGNSALAAGLALARLLGTADALTLVIRRRDAARRRDR